MKTKAEILHSYITCTCDYAYKLRKLTDPDCGLCNNEDQILEAMDEYAKQIAIEFAEWTSENNFERMIGLWHHESETRSYTTSELFDKFLNERSAQ